ncbi:MULTISPECIES: hypothetical protein [unclassified Sulfitobacter]|jgi:hypothetical protein|uniref:hypothetical protein n=1 Tax=unclassified Sulfitobacter TaxID=196795 RepID=UPI0011105EEE|nr:hypothetical protein [Sulfitobacter sp. BSw21498]|tara:strand:- start:776 stop:1354 length:579 start_codon:yes stop_codon:yes gene_type:complete
MRFTLHHKFIASIAAAAVAITAFTAVPAAAGDRNRDLAKIAVGVLGVAIVGKIIHDKNKRDDERARQEVSKHRHAPDTVYRAPRPPRAEHVPVYRAPKAQRHVEPRPLPKGYKRQQYDRHANAKLLPKQCFQSFDTRRGQVLMFGRRCLENNFRHADRLPQQCAQQIRTHRGTRNGYDARCLRGAGYSLARG